MLNILHFSQKELIDMLPIFVGVAGVYVCLNYLWTKASTFLYKLLAAISLVKLLTKYKPEKANGNGVVNESPLQKRANKKALDRKNKIENDLKNQPKHYVENKPIINRQPSVEIVLPLNPAQIISNNLVAQLKGHLQSNNNSSALPLAHSLAANPAAEWRNVGKNHDFSRYQPLIDRNKIQLQERKEAEMAAVVAMASNYYLQNCRPAFHADHKKEPQKFKEKIEKSCKDILLEIQSLQKDKENSNKNNHIPEASNKPDNDLNHEVEQAAQVIKQLVADQRSIDLICNYGWDKNSEFAKIFGNQADGEYTDAVMRELLTGNYNMDISSVLNEQNFSPAFKPV